MRFPIRLAVGAALAAVLFASMGLHAQWVYVGRKALGKVQSLTQKEKTGAPGYSVATVVLEGSADRVYATAVKAAETSPRARLTQQDAPKRTLEFVVDGQVVGLKVSQVDSKKVQVLIASTILPDKTDATPATVEATLRICKEMGAVCNVVP